MDREDVAFLGNLLVAPVPRESTRETSISLGVGLMMVYDLAGAHGACEGISQAHNLPVDNILRFSVSAAVPGQGRVCED